MDDTPGENRESLIDKESQGVFSEIEGAETKDPHEQIERAKRLGKDKGLGWNNQIRRIRGNTKNRPTSNHKQ